MSRWKIPGRIASASLSLLLLLSSPRAGSALLVPGPGPCPRSPEGIATCLMERGALQTRIQQLVRASSAVQAIEAKLETMRQRLKAMEAAREVREANPMKTRCGRQLAALRGDVSSLHDNEGRLQTARQGLAASPQMSVTYAGGSRFAGRSSCPVRDYGPGSMSPGALGKSFTSLISSLNRTMRGAKAAACGTGAEAIDSQVAGDAAQAIESARNVERQTEQAEEPERDDLSEVQNEVNLDLAEAAHNDRDSVVTKTTSTNGKVQVTTVTKTNPGTQFRPTTQSSYVTKTTTTPPDETEPTKGKDGQVLPPGVGNSGPSTGGAGGVTVAPDGSLVAWLPDGCTLTLHKTEASPTKGWLTRFPVLCIGEDCGVDVADKGVWMAPARTFTPCPPEGAGGNADEPVPARCRKKERFLGSGAALQKIKAKTCVDCTRGPDGPVKGPEVHELPASSGPKMPHFNPAALRGLAITHDLSLRSGMTLVIRGRGTGRTVGIKSRSGRTRWYRGAHVLKNGNGQLYLKLENGRILSLGAVRDGTDRAHR